MLQLIINVTSAEAVSIYNKIDSFGDKNRVNRSNFNVTILKFFEKFDHPLSHVFIFVNIFPESHGLGAMPVTSRFIDTCSIYSYLISDGRRNCST